MKIAVVLGPFQPLPPTGMGAVEKVWYELSSSFAAAGHQVLLIGKAGDEVRHDPPGVRVRRLRGYSAARSLLRNLLVDFVYAFQVRAAMEPADVVVTNSFWTPVVLSLTSKAPPIVVHVARFPKRQMWLYRKAAMLQTVSSAVAREISRQAPSLASKIRVLPYPIDVHTFHPTSAVHGEGHRTIIYVGRIHPEKGLHLLLRAFREVEARVPGVRLRVIGPAEIASGGGGSAYLRELQALGHGLPVTFDGPIADQAKLAEVLRDSDCFCYPSLADKGEAFGRSVLEAMAAGLPVVVSDLECFRDFVESEKEGIIFDHRHEDAAARLTAALIRVLRDSELAKSMGARAANKASLYGLNSVAARYLEMLESCQRPRAVPVLTGVPRNS